MTGPHKSWRDPPSYLMAWKKGLTFCSQAPLVGIPPSSAYEKTALCLIKAVISVGWQSIFGCFIVYPFVHRRKTLFKKQTAFSKSTIQKCDACLGLFLFAAVWEMNQDSAVLYRETKNSVSLRMSVMCWGTEKSPPLPNRRSTDLDWQISQKPSRNALTPQRWVYRALSCNELSQMIWGFAGWLLSMK